MTHDYTNEQEERLSALADEHPCVRVRPTRPSGTFSIVVDCLRRSPEEDQVISADDIIRTYRIMPSGYSIDISPGQPAVRSDGGQL